MSNLTTASVAYKMLKELPKSQRQDMINLFTEQVMKPTGNPFMGSTRNGAFYVPKMQAVIDLLARNRERMNTIPDFNLTASQIGLSKDFPKETDDE